MDGVPYRRSEWFTREKLREKAGKRQADDKIKRFTKQRLEVEAQWYVIVFFFFLL
jgi:hypothetical protein